MNGKNVTVNNGKLPIVSLTSGILALSPILAYLALIIITYTLLKNPIDEKLILNIMIPFLIIGIILAINAIVCGCMNYRQKREDIHIKSKNFNIAGIIMGTIVILFAIFFLL